MDRTVRRSAGVGRKQIHWTPRLIKELRGKRTLTEFGELVGASKNTVWRWESARTHPDPSYRRRLSEVAEREGFLAGWKIVGSMRLVGDLEGAEAEIAKLFRKSLARTSREIDGWGRPVSLYVTDTHPLVWYTIGKHAQLSKNALRAFNAAARSEALIYIPPFVLWEVAMLLRVGRIELSEDYEDWANHLLGQHGFDLAEFSVAMAATAYRYPFSDPFDGVIAATAKVMDLPLITRDMEITESRRVEVYW
jgi:PIN domain nuclease of toxin-antitoxin system